MMEINRYLILCSNCHFWYVLCSTIKIKNRIGIYKIVCCTVYIILVPHSPAFPPRIDIPYLFYYMHLGGISIKANPQDILGCRPLYWLILWENRWDTEHAKRI